MCHLSLTHQFIRRFWVWNAIWHRLFMLLWLYRKKWWLSTIIVVLSSSRSRPNIIYTWPFCHSPTLKRAMLYFSTLRIQIVSKPSCMSQHKIYKNVTHIKQSGLRMKDKFFGRRGMFKSHTNHWRAIYEQNVHSLRIQRMLWRFCV